jgi:hypothetical protein
MAVVACRRFILVSLRINLAVCSCCYRRRPYSNVWEGRFWYTAFPRCVLKKSALCRVPRSPIVPITGQYRHYRKKRPGLEPSAAQKRVASSRSYSLLYGTDTSAIQAAEGKLLLPDISHGTCGDLILWPRLDTRHRIGRGGPSVHATESPADGDEVSSPSSAKSKRRIPNGHGSGNPLKLHRLNHR